MVVLWKKVVKNVFCLFGLKTEFKEIWILFLNPEDHHKDLYKCTDWFISKYNQLIAKYQDFGHVFVLIHLVKITGAAKSTVCSSYWVYLTLTWTEFFISAF